VGSNPTAGTWLIEWTLSASGTAIVYSESRSIKLWTGGMDT